MLNGNKIQYRPRLTFPSIHMENRQLLTEMLLLFLFLPGNFFLEAHFNQRLKENAFSSLILPTVAYNYCSVPLFFSFKKTQKLETLATREEVRYIALYLSYRAHFSLLNID